MGEPRVAAALDRCTETLAPPQPGRCHGLLTTGDSATELSHAYAHLHDNAEGIIATACELRIALVDRPVDGRALHGLVFLDITRLAREGGVRGLLIRRDPANLRTAEVTYLARPASEWHSLATTTLCREHGEALPGLVIEGGRIHGTIDYRDGFPGADDHTNALSRLILDARITREPAITAELHGVAAQNSLFTILLQGKARAMRDGDLDTMRRLNSDACNREMDSFIDQSPEMAREVIRAYALEWQEMLHDIRRVVVRGDRATVLLHDTRWATLIRERGRWKVDT